jgi:hypothetical protein
MGRKEGSDLSVCHPEGLNPLDSEVEMAKDGLSV